MDSVLQLFPSTGQRHPLKGLYLNQGLNWHVSPSGDKQHGELVIYSNFISSLDGRIALFDVQRGDFGVPESLANARDWRLYQELAAQSDVMITSARYFRQLAQGCAQDLLPVGQGPSYQDLAAWRLSYGLKAQPDVLIVSSSLDIPVQALATLHDRHIMVITSSACDISRRIELERAGAEVIVSGSCEQVKNTRVRGFDIRLLLQQKGYAAAYMIAGPQVHHTLLLDGVLDRLFLTTRFRLLGSSAFHTILEGDIPPVELELDHLFLDEQEQQCLAAFTIQKPRRV